MSRIHSVEISNIKGVSFAKFPVGTLTLLKGENGSGKTSVLDSIAAIFEGGHDPAMLRTGTEEGYILLTLEDGTTILKTVKPTESKLDIRTGDGSIVKAPAAFVSKLANSFGYDPVSFLVADPKKRIKFLLDVLPVYFTPEEIDRAIQTTMEDGNKVPEALDFSREIKRPAITLNLEGIDQYRAGIYEDRRALNAAGRRYNESYDTLQAALPPEVGNAQEIVIAAKELREKHGGIKQQIKTAASEIDSSLEAAIKHRRSTFYAEKAALDSALLAEITLLRETCDRKVAELKVSSEEDVQALIVEAANQKDAAIGDLTKQADETYTELLEAENKSKRVSEAAGIQKALEDLRGEIRKYTNREAAFTSALKAVDELKIGKLAAKDLGEISLKGGEIFVGGVPFDHLNTQKQYFVAFTICAYGAGDLQFMVSDRVESIVGENWEAFKEAAEASGFQVIAARAEDRGGLVVEVDDQALPIEGDGIRSTRKRGKNAGADNTEADRPESTQSPER